ncbi:adenylate/guanylate cyclase domain-containing protein [Williamsia sp. D3]|uniref:adenylate/guanylate cyclase domain-containing protein n=1 Tax=Williamsia sp. D3 TaxID=1313067 RepID=UPI0003D2C857|nr:adenylate/guanylate cyclase domain-containing protein [Williamsia sp. D3]ETD30617.1 guanylyl cyclase [Williamsia sp. D3]
MTDESDVSAEAIESLLLGGKRLFTREDVTAALNIPTEFADRVWTAFGFAMDKTDEPLFTADDVQALQLVHGLDEAQPEEFEIGMARALGQTMSRLAEWQAHHIAERMRAADSPDLAQMLQAVQRVQILIWRRHLSAALQNALSMGEGENRTMAIGFVDIVGYTSLSRKIGMEELDDLLETFETNAFEVVNSRGGHVVKTLGDAVMFSTEDPVAGAEIAIALQHLSAEHGLPPLRVGVALGTVLTRLGDVFGEPVNIAARLTSSARPGTVLTDTTFANAVDDERFFFKSVGPLNVRGYKRLRARSLEPNRKPANVTDS